MSYVDKISEGNFNNVHQIFSQLVHLYTNGIILERFKARKSNFQKENRGLKGVFNSRPWRS